MTAPLTPADWRERVLAEIRGAGRGVHASWIVSRFDAPHAYRAVDRALQSLRKAGLIQYDSKKGWTIRDA